MSKCEKNAEKLSAWLDGELGEGEARSLMEHLETCPRCRGLKQGFAAVDGLVTRFKATPGTLLEDRVRSRLSRKPPEWRRSLLSVAAAALILIAISLVILVTGDSAAAGRAAESMAALESMNHQALEEQDALLKTLEWQLNAMKMEVSYSDLDEQKAGPFIQRIEYLLNELENVRFEDNNKDKGEER